MFSVVLAKNNVLFFINKHIFSAFKLTSKKNMGLLRKSSNKIFQHNDSKNKSLLQKQNRTIQIILVHAICYYTKITNATLVQPQINVP